MSVCMCMRETFIIWCACVCVWGGHECVVTFIVSGEPDNRTFTEQNKSDKMHLFATSVKLSG